MTEQQRYVIEKLKQIGIGLKHGKPDLTRDNASAIISRTNIKVEIK